MVARTLISDSGAVVRQAKRLPISDSGGVTRIAKRVFISDSGAVARLVFTGADFLALVAAGAPVAGSNGYVQGSFGSLTPSVLGDGTTVIEMAASVTTPFPLILQITGYPGSITSSYLTSLTLNAAVFLASAATFGGGGGGGSATWSWSSGFHFLNSAHVAVIVQRT